MNAKENGSVKRRGTLCKKSVIARSAATWQSKAVRVARCLYGLLRFARKDGGVFAKSGGTLALSALLIAALVIPQTALAAEASAPGGEAAGNVVAVAAGGAETGADATGEAVDGAAGGETQDSGSDATGEAADSGQPVIAGAGPQSPAIATGAGAATQPAGLALENTG
ncbi:MAG: hypothetical protein LBS91_07510 [Clostridiales Family XIII bacterium]|jgi:hypothetical protein|nr:hypothetical protein [Clostridiales Family XIII bacterium]